MKNKKVLLLIILILATGFAAVSTNLLINGSASISTNKSDFDVVFANALASEENKTSSKTSEFASAKIESDKKTITFSTQDLAAVGEWARVDYEIVNNSKSYDAEITMKLELVNTSDQSFVDEYLIIDTYENWRNDKTIEAGTRDTGWVKVELKKSFLGDANVNEPKEVKFKVSYDAKAVSRTEEAVISEITVYSKNSSGENLNARSYNITGLEKEELLTKLEESHMISDASEIDALIEVEADDFEDFAETTFDVSPIAEPGDKVIILHYNELIEKWEYIGTETVDENGEIKANFTSYSPVAFAKVDPNGNILSLDYEATPVYHTHTGSSSSGGGCYRTPNYKYETCQQKCGTFYMTLNASMGDGTSHWKCSGCGTVYYRSGNVDAWDHYKTASCRTNTILNYSLSCGKTPGVTIDGYTCPNGGTLNNTTHMCEF